jgi:hypothetical protein
VRGFDPQNAKHTDSSEIDQANLSAAEYKRISERLAAAELREEKRFEREAALEASRKMVSSSLLG